MQYTTEDTPHMVTTESWFMLWPSHSIFANKLTI